MLICGPYDRWICVRMHTVRFYKLRKANLELLACTVPPNPPRGKLLCHDVRNTQNDHVNNVSTWVDCFETTLRTMIDDPTFEVNRGTCVYHKISMCAVWFQSNCVWSTRNRYVRVCVYLCTHVPHFNTCLCRRFDRKCHPKDGIRDSCTRLLFGKATREIPRFASFQDRIWYTYFKDNLFYSSGTNAIVTYLVTRWWICRPSFHLDTYIYVCTPWTDTCARKSIVFRYLAHIFIYLTNPNLTQVENRHDIFLKNEIVHFFMFDVYCKWIENLKYDVVEVCVRTYTQHPLVTLTHMHNDHAHR